MEAILGIVLGLCGIGVWAIEKLWPVICIGLASVAAHWWLRMVVKEAVNEVIEQHGLHIDPRRRNEFFELQREIRRSDAENRRTTPWWRRY